MRKHVLLIMLIGLLSIGFIACAQPAEDSLTDSNISAENNQDPAEGIGMNDGSQPDQSDEIFTDTGRFMGRVDNNFIQVKISGVPDEIDPSELMLSENIKEEFNRLQLEDEEEIKFEYYINEHDQKVIINIWKI